MSRHQRLQRDLPRKNTEERSKTIPATTREIVNDSKRCKVVKNRSVSFSSTSEASLTRVLPRKWFYIKMTFYHRSAKVKVPPSSKIIKIQIPLGIFKKIFFLTKSTTISKIEVPFLRNEPLKLVVRFLSFTILSNLEYQGFREFSSLSPNENSKFDKTMKERKKIVQVLRGLCKVETSIFKVNLITSV